MKKLSLKRFVIFLLWVVLAVYLSCCVIVPLFHKKVSQSQLDTASTLLQQPVHGAPEQILCVDQNEEALLWRLRLIRSAQERLVMTTFAFSDDNSGTDLLSALYDAAQRGVQIQILIDGMDGTLNLSHSPLLGALTTLPNVEAKLYNPLNLLKPWRLNYRMHDKYVIADDTAYLLGGRNTNDLFLGEYAQKCNIDREILVWQTQPGKGQSFLELQDYFQTIWEMPCSKSISPRVSEKKLESAFASLKEHFLLLEQRFPAAFEPVNWAEETIPANSVHLLHNPQQPQNKEPLLWSSLCELMNNSSDILIQTPYVICNRSMYDDLTALEGDGRQIKIITNAIASGANPWGCSDYLNQKKNILKTGAEIYELYGERSSHTKTMVLDDRLSVVGSFNLDMRSAYLDTEMMLLIDCPELNQQLRNQASKTMERSNHVLPDGTQTPGEQYHPPKVGWMRLAIYQVLRILILPIRHLL